MSNLLSPKQIGDIGNYVKEGENVDVMSFNDKPVTISLQPKSAYASWKHHQACAVIPVVMLPG